MRYLLIILTLLSVSFSEDSEYKLSDYLDELSKTNFNFYGIESGMSSSMVQGILAVTSPNNELSPKWCKYYDSEDGYVVYLRNNQESFVLNEIPYLKHIQFEFTPEREALLKLVVVFKPENMTRIEHVAIGNLLKEKFYDAQYSYDSDSDWHTLIFHDKNLELEWTEIYEVKLNLFDKSELDIEFTLVKNNSSMLKAFEKLSIEMMTDEFSKYLYGDIFNNFK